ncbi:unnamed protein product [Moneuplotes crassus]|uniref:Uncharacterized protein n=1 Tax=Euplotes crassus TaxID=5936 RepID=A0AAD1XCL5_EUPCR|nr:unnamed protein product [Moneuplotes crassus]
MMNNRKYQLKQMFSWSKNLKNGPWTNEEHAQFIKCLKTYGINWPKLREMIPSRTRHQIKSHQRRYFYQIKKHFGLEDPMEYILANKCDNLRFYKNGKTHDEGNQEIEDEGISQTCKNAKKRDSKYFEKKQEEEFGLEKIFSIQKVKRDKSFELGKFVKSQRLKEDTTKDCTDFMTQNSFKAKETISQNNNTFLVLGNGEVIVAGDIVKSLVPCDVKKIDSGMSIIQPNQNVTVSIKSIPNDLSSHASQVQCSIPIAKNQREVNTDDSMLHNLNNEPSSHICTESEQCNVFFEAIELLRPYYCFKDLLY